ncbi:catalytic subunit DNA polymeras-like protein delta [Delitschia confertaspora ATCC 74209]|uniref:DNA polymerase n=1 Tax=Delitschia confertaspora ATCC 74209 TaxID=1513339 RepID=A0A9P4JMN3_9PLEO|nr:catalytic subunit DNA polymeras-like protein delta [Delitschia confertaspora ATCC 74209]
MPAAVQRPPAKRVLAESTSTRSNVQNSPRSAKKLKLDNGTIRNGLTPKVANGGLHSSQPKSQFEEEVLEKLTQDMNGLKQKNTERDQQWKRPPLDDFNEIRDSICFQQIEVEEGAIGGGKTAVKLFGVTETGHSVLLHVTHFLHYFYIAAPVGFQKHDCEPYKVFLEAAVAKKNTLYSAAVHSVQMTMKENLYGFQGNQKSPYLKITVTDPKIINRVRMTIMDGDANYKSMWKGASEGGILTFDNIQYILRFMIDTNISGMSWVEAPAGKYKMINPRDRQSNCQIEASIHYQDLIAHPSEGEWAKMAPLRILSFDIECAGRKGIFPEANVDPVIQIANVVTRYGEAKPFVRNVFCLDTCSQIVATQIFSFENEGEMLMKWRDFVEEVDPDVIIGYNIANFDMPYLLNRASHLKQPRFPYWSRLKNVMSKAEKTNFSSKQMGSRDSQSTNTNGRLQLDLLQLVQRDHQLRSYTLNSVCAHFLKEQKEDVHHSMITELFNGDANSRRRLAVYCLKDAYLPQRLLDKLMCLVNYTEMARVTGVPFNYLISRGQQIKFISQLFRKALEQSLVIPDLSTQGSDDQYEGATVIEPKRGYYDVPVATLDFASLYPSIIQAHNLCYTTLLNKAAVQKLDMKKDEDYIVTPNGDMFATEKVRKGLLSQILEELLSARKRAKRELAVETDPFKKAVLNGRQLALKVSANSVYGITGATVGKLPCLAIASSTTSYGRQMIEKTKHEVEQKYTMANGYTHDAEVIYGDTDSVMVKFGTSELAKAMELGQEAADYVSSKFIKPIKLEFEKVYFPYLLINKKRYAGLYWTNPNKWDKMDTKGIETVRRDNCRLVQNVIETSLRMLLIDRDVNGAQEFVKETISDLLQNKVDMSNLVITKALTKGTEDEGDAPEKSNAKAKKNVYASKQAHVELAARMKKRDAGSAPALGDRVAYVIIKGAGGAKNYEKSEDPIYVLENNLPIDTKYYLENQLAKPLGRIFEPILGEKKASQLLNGEHTRSISVAAPSMGGLMKFAKKTQTCMGCKKPLVSSLEKEGAVCENCRPRLGELYNKTLNKVSELEVRFARLWTQCQRCQGSVHCEVICSSRDCPIFYMRMKARKDVEDAGRELERFDRDAALW